MRHKELKAKGRKYILLIFEQTDKIMIKMNLTFRSHGNCQQPTSCRRTLSSTVKSRHKKIYFQHTTEAFDDKDNYCLFEDEDFFFLFFFFQKHFAWQAAVRKHLIFRLWRFLSSFVDGITLSTRAHEFVLAADTVEVCKCFLLTVGYRSLVRRSVGTWPTTTIRRLKAHTARVARAGGGGAGVG